MISFGLILFLVRQIFTFQLADLFKVAICSVMWSSSLEILICDYDVSWYFQNQRAG